MGSSQESRRRSEHKQDKRENGIDCMCGGAKAGRRALRAASVHTRAVRYGGVYVSGRTVRAARGGDSRFGETLVLLRAAQKRNTYPIRILNRL